MFYLRLGTKFKKKSFKKNSFFCSYLTIELNIGSKLRTKLVQSSIKIKNLYKNLCKIRVSKASKPSPDPGKNDKDYKNWPVSYSLVDPMHSLGLLDPQDPKGPGHPLDSLDQVYPRIDWV